MPLPSLSYPDVVNFPTGKLTGRSTASTGALEAITLNAAFTLSGGSLTIAAGGVTNAMLANSAVANLSGTNTGDQTSVSGNAGTATALQTARAINGVNFDGSAAITVAAAAGTLTGTTLASNVVTSSLTTIGTLVGGSIPYSLVTGGPTAVTPASPSASVGLSAVNGSAATFLRSDGAPALDQTAAFAFTGLGTTNLLSASVLQWNSDLFLTRKGAASLQLGAADAASPVAQTLGVQNVVAGTTNTAGADWTFGSSLGTGNVSTGGGFIWKAGATGSTGTVQQTPTTVMSLTKAGLLTVANGLTVSSGNLSVSSATIGTLTSNIGDLTITAGKAFVWNGRSFLESGVDGNIAFKNSAGTGFGRLQFGGTTSSFPAIKQSSTSLAFRLADDSADCAITCAGISASGKLTTYNNIATAGWSVPAIYAAGRSVAQSAAVASVATYTVGAADGSFEVGANVLVTTSTLHTFTVTVAYTDEGNTSRVLTLQFSNLAGTFLTAIANAAGAVPYEGVSVIIRCKASTSITIATAAGGTYTTVTYNVEGFIKQVS